MNNRSEIVYNTLNPKYFWASELDCDFPNNYELKVRVYNAATIKAFDTLIGEAKIDLEDRYFGNSL